MIQSDLWPHVVHVPHHVLGKHRREMILWLEEHMGSRSMAPEKNSWSHPRYGVYAFREQGDALEFTLRWL